MPIFYQAETTTQRPDGEMCYRARMSASIAELVVLAAVVWLISRLLEPLRRRFERLIMRLIAPDRADIIDAVIESVNKKRKE